MASGLRGKWQGGPLTSKQLDRDAGQLGVCELQPHPWPWVSPQSPRCSGRAKGLSGLPRGPPSFLGG